MKVPAQAGSSSARCLSRTPESAAGLSLRAFTTGQLPDGLSDSDDTSVFQLSFTTNSQQCIHASDLLRSEHIPLV